MSLSDSAIQAAKPRQKRYALSDGNGLRLIVTPEGGRWWRLRYTLHGKEKGISLGVYPDVSLKRARERRDEARKLIVEGTDPSARRKAARNAHGDTLEAITLEYLASERKRLKAATVELIRNRILGLSRHLLSRPIATIEARELLDELRKIEARGRHDTAIRTKSDVGRVFRYAVATSRASRDITQDLKGLIKAAPTRHFAALTAPAQVGSLLRAIDGYQGQPATEIALKLAPLVFVRPGELRTAEWREFDLESNQPEWRIPGTKTKMKREHVVPLSRQAVKLLRELDAHTGGGRLLFPTLRDPTRSMSENTLNAALRRMGYTKDQQTAHGFRSIASTLLNELGCKPDVVELQLAHKEGNKSRAAYLRATFMAERRELMQRWADYLDGLKAPRRAA